jgi:DHA2 family multidrug resistance protein-like MFS transporter
MAHTIAAGAQATAGQTLAGAAAASTHLPARAAAGLLDTARAAFTSGLHVTAVVAAVIFAALALFIAAARPGRAAAETPAAAADEAYEGARS